MQNSFGPITFAVGMIMIAWAAIANVNAPPVEHCPATAVLLNHTCTAVDDITTTIDPQGFRYWSIEVGADPSVPAREVPYTQIARLRPPGNS